MNLLEFDNFYGHRNDPQGYARALEEFDAQLPLIQKAMREKDVLIITADHGNDPSGMKPDHTREYVPILVSGKAVLPSVYLGIRETFADIAATIADFFDVKPLEDGTSFSNLLVKAS